jgi:hypothetical protein
MRIWTGITRRRTAGDSSKAMTALPTARMSIHSPILRCMCWFVYILNAKIMKDERPKTDTEIKQVACGTKAIYAVAVRVR